MSTNRFLGGAPSRLLRISYAVFGVATLAFVVEMVPGDPMLAVSQTWATRADLVGSAVVGAVALVQAVAPLRFFWPGWILAAHVVFNISFGSLTTLSVLPHLRVNGLSLLNHHVLLYWGAPLLATLGLFVAFLAWEVPVKQRSKPTPPTETANAMPDLGGPMANTWTTST
ncbi:hypothetical protein [Nocardioides sp.]|uniref:hypothetical protein n=1 Tax=Nocardioides sp. TaxID=35761 RepID=UPI00261E7404|nr:hypothetical protein [Nocardioides sp.]